jgi:Domain of unknown function (DU1801)
MPKADLKTKPTKSSVAGFLSKVDAKRRQDCEAIVDILRRASGAEPEMWGPSIIGFGRFHYKSASGREGDWMILGFSPRKSDLTLYGLGVNTSPDLFARLGKHTTGKGCLYIKKLEDVDPAVLRELAEQAVGRVDAQRVDKPKRK